MHYLTNKKILTVLLASVVVGCGGGSSSSAPQSGQPVVTSVLVDGVEIRSKTYTVYSVVDDEGTLSDKPLSREDEAKLPHVLLLSSVSSANHTGGPRLTTDQYKACYHDFWQSISQQIPNRTAAQVVQRLNDFDMTIDELCDQQQASGLTVDQYVELFRVVAKYWPNDKDIDGKIARFFNDLEIPANEFKKTLSELGYTWDDFVKRLAATQGGGHAFINEYAVSPLALEPFLRDYMTRPAPIVASIGRQLKLLNTFLAQDINPRLFFAAGPARVYAQAATPADPFATAGKIFEAITGGTNVAVQVFNFGKTVWQFLKENVGVVEEVKGDASSKIIAATDINELNYQYAKNSRSPVVSFVGRSFFFGAWETYHVDAQLSVDYGATHQDIGGQWMPDIRVLVKKVVVPVGYKISGDAKLSNVVNRGSNTDPIPEVQVNVTLSSTNLTTVNQAFSFTANAATGAGYIE